MSSFLELARFPWTLAENFLSLFEKLSAAVVLANKYMYWLLVCEEQLFCNVTSREEFLDEKNLCVTFSFNSLQRL